MNFKHLLLALASSLTFGTSALYAHEPNTILDEAFLQEHLPYAQKLLYYYRIPISITLGQSAIESGFGKSELARFANNYFGMKANSGWNGLTYTKDTEESEDGKIIVVSAKFRQYANIEDCYADRGVFLTSSQHYASLFELQTNDYVGWARGLKAAKYATDPQYDQKLISVIKTNKFDQYDEVISKAAVAFNNQGRTSNQVSITQVATINPNNSPKVILTPTEMLAYLENITAASEREHADLQMQINELKRIINADRSKDADKFDEIFRRLDELTAMVYKQGLHLQALQDCLRDVELQQQVLFNADPLRKQFTPNGELRSQMEIFPVTKNQNKNVFYINGKRVVNLQPNQTLLNVAIEHNIEYRDILEYNDLTADIAENANNLLPNMYIFLEPKVTSFSNIELVHTVRAGETLHSISQLEGVKLSKIAQRNQINIEQGEEPAIGQPIFINKKASKKPVVRSRTDVSTPFGSGGISPEK
jgi:hypothetical protein